MSARLLVLLVTCYLLLVTFVSSVYAQQEGDLCKYNQQLEDSTIEECNGVYMDDNIDDETVNLVCQFNSTVNPECKKVEQPSPSSDLLAPEAPSIDNWDAPTQTAYTGSIGIVNLFSCLGTNLPYGTKGCPNVFFSGGTQEVKLTYNGEGGGALGASSRFMAAMYNSPPASGVQYMAKEIQNLGPKVAHAQVGGSGAEVIRPVEKVWQVSRDITYLLFVVVFVVAGLMIMFRARLNPQTVVSIQAALPGLVIGLVLVTFSYFISGLIIDLAFLGSQVVGILFLSQVGGDTNAITHVREILNGQNVITMFSNFIFTGNLIGAANNISTSVYDIIVNNPQNRAIAGIIGVLGACLNPLTIATVAPTGGLSIAACIAAGGVGGASGGGLLISSLVYLVLLFGLLQAMFRLLFTLIGAYISVVVSTIFAPFIILWSAVPGQGGILALWWRGLLGNALVFPAVFGVFLLVATILGRSDWYLDRSIVLPFNQTLPLFGASPTGFIQALLAYGLLLALPGVPDLVREALHARPNQIIQGAVNRGFATGTAGAQVAATRVIPSTFRAIRRFLPF